jgi:hypothetical protein
LDYHRVVGFFGDAYAGRTSGGRNGGLLGVQLSWASLQAPRNFAKYDAVVVCVGTNNQYDGEGLDRQFDLPEFQGELIQNLANVNPRTIVITHGGGSFNAEPWINQARALIQAFYPGQNGGQAIAEILFGTVNPSGKLPISWEKLAQDNLPSQHSPCRLISTRPRCLIRKVYLLDIADTKRIMSNRCFRSDSGCLTPTSLSPT